MNKSRRRRISEIQSLLFMLCDELEATKDEEMESFWNIPENFRTHEAWRKNESILLNLECARDGIEDAALELDDYEHDFISEHINDHKSRQRNCVNGKILAFKVDNKSKA